MTAQGVRRTAILGLTLSLLVIIAPREVSLKYSQALADSSPSIIPAWSYQLGQGQNDWAAPFDLSTLSDSSLIGLGTDAANSEASPQINGINHNGSPAWPTINRSVGITGGIYSYPDQKGGFYYIDYGEQILSYYLDGIQKWSHPFDAGVGENTVTWGENYKRSFAAVASNGNLYSLAYGVGPSFTLDEFDASDGHVIFSNSNQFSRTGYSGLFAYKDGLVGVTGNNVDYMNLSAQVVAEYPLSAVDSGIGEMASMASGYDGSLFLSFENTVDYGKKVPGPDDCSAGLTGNDTLLKFSPLSGLAWTHTFPTDLQCYDGQQEMVALPDGGAAITLGKTGGNGSGITKISPAGDFQWSVDTTSTIKDVPGATALAGETSLIADQNDNVIATSMTSAPWPGGNSNHIGVQLTILSGADGGSAAPPYALMDSPSSPDYISYYATTAVDQGRVYVSVAKRSQISSTSDTWDQYVEALDVPTIGDDYARQTVRSGTSTAPSGGNSKAPAAPNSHQQYLHSHGTSLSASNTATNGEPVNMVGGNFLLTRHDLSRPGHDLPVNFNVSYNSDSASQDSPMGFGWTNSYRMAVVQESSGSVVVYNQDGRMDEYTPDGLGMGGYAPPVGVHASLLQVPGGSYLLTEKNHVQYGFKSDGLLTSITSQNGNQQKMGYNASNELTTITDVLGRNFSLSYDPDGHITKITDPTGRSVQYAYDARGNLAAVTDAAGNMTKYSYDAGHRITTITDPRNNPGVTNTYDANGRVTSQTNALGATVNLTYGPGQTIYTDAKGGKTTYFSDGQLRLTKVQDANGGITSYTYDPGDNQNSITDPKGLVTTMTYDGLGNLTHEVDPAHGTTAHTYDSANNVTSSTDPLGHTTHFVYDTNNNVIQLLDAAANKTSYSYDKFGDLVSTTDPTGAVINRSYDALGNVTSVTDPLNRVTKISYDSAGRPITAITPGGKTTSYTYDALDRLTQTKNPLGATTSVAYDANGNEVNQTDANAHVTSYAYDKANQLASVSDALGHTTKYAYDANGNFTTQTDANNHTTTYAYDVLDRVIASINPLSQATNQTYDADGNVVSSTDQNGHRTAYSYDPFGNLTSKVFADHTSTTYTYDAAGNRTQMTDATGRTSYAYDVLGDRTKVVSPGNTAIGYTYDANSHQTGITYPDGRKESYSYDAAGELTNAKDWSNKVTTYSYGPDAQITKVNYPNSTSITYGYDIADQLTSVVNKPKFGPATSFTYALDPAGNRTSVTNQYGLKTSYAYNQLEQLTGVTSRRVNQGYSYDPAGNRVTQTNNRQTTSYTYNAGDELMSAGSITYGYDANGNRTQETQFGRSTDYAYNDAGELISISNGRRVSSQYAYNGDGNRTSSTVGHEQTSYLWDPNSTLPQLLSQTTDDGATTDYQYGQNLISSDGSNPNNQKYYQFDGLGSVVGQTGQHGQVLDSYKYDAYGSPTSWSSALGGNSNQNPFGFAGQQQDSNTGLSYMRARYYDPSTGTFISRDSLPATSVNPQTINRYTYTLNDPVNFTDPSGRSIDWVSFLEGQTVAAIGQVGSIVGPSTSSVLSAGLSYYDIRTSCSAGGSRYDCSAASGGAVITGAGVAAGGAGVGYAIAGVTAPVWVPTVGFASLVAGTAWADARELFRSTKLYDDTTLIPRHPKARLSC